MEAAKVISCLICREVLEFPRNLFDAIHKKLLDVLHRLLGYEVYIEGNLLNICNSCERKLNWISEFQLLCLKALEKYKNVECKKEYITDEDISLILKEEGPYIHFHHSGDEGDKTVDSEKNKDTLKQIRRIEVKGRGRPKRKSTDGTTVEPSPKKKRSIIRISKNKRSQQFPEDDVLQAIKEAENYLTDMKNRKCSFCEHVASTANMLRMHMGGKHKDALKKWCKYCNLQAENLKEHQRIKSCNELRCKFCKKRCKNWTRMKRHLRIHCLDKFPNAADLIDRKEINVKLPLVKRPEVRRVKELLKKYLCPVCGKVFISHTGFKNHVSSHNSPKKLNDEQFKCSICGKYLNDASALLTHTKRHKGVMKFVCPVCGKGSFDNATHKRHLEIHELGPAQCPICEKQFRRPGLLKMHMREHTGDNQYHCLPCGKSYPVKSMLQYHLKMHKDDRPHQCGYCGKGFKDDGTRKKHEMIHTGTKPFKCSVCSFRCVQAQTLTTHMKQHPEDAPQADKPHKCSSCYRSFSTNALLMSHSEISHKKQKVDATL